MRYSAALIVFLCMSCTTLPPRCASVSIHETFSLAGTIQSRAFSGAIYLRTYHFSSIAPAERLSSDDAEPPVKVGVRLSDDCKGTQRLAARLGDAQLSRISGFGYYNTEYGSYVIDCLCSVEKLPDPTPEQLRRLMIPY
jgi:hypothetical protein